MSVDKGPRRLLFGHLRSKAAPLDASSTGTKAEVDVDGKPISLPQPSAIPNLQFPGLQFGQSYKVNITQTITTPDATGNTQTQESSKSKDFHPWELDLSLIDSVSPPQGYSDYANVLPHVVFNNPQVPWMSKKQSSEGRLQVPWLALLLFTEDELTLTPSQLSLLGPNVTQNANLAISSTLESLTKLDTTQFNQPISSIPPSIDRRAPVQSIFIQGDLFDSIFASYILGSSKPAEISSTSKPNIEKFAYLSHVRIANTQGMKDQDSDSSIDAFSVTLSQRPGPLDPSKLPVTVFAHLVSLDGIPSMTMGSGKLCGLASLHSWSYTCLPPTAASMSHTLQKLGQNIQPLRKSSLLSIDPNRSTSAEKWVYKCQHAGYTQVKYRTRTGETTTAVQRGPLSPIARTPIQSSPSNNGTDLAILDKDVGILDNTYQLAWKLGKSLSLADRTFTTALTRFRAAVHTAAIRQAKSQNDGNATTSTSPQTSNADIGISKRWTRNSASQDLQSTIDLKNHDEVSKYKLQVLLAATSMSGGVGERLLSECGKQNQESPSPSPPYNEFNLAASTEWSTILPWCLDRYFLQEIPHQYLIPDPDFIPEASIRTFYVDKDWIETLIDGALSIGNHSFQDDDPIRAAIKANIQTYQKTPLPNGFPAQIPQWGCFIRSAFIAKYPDLRVQAPWPESFSDALAEVVAMERINDELLLLLFDRTPESGNFPSGIKLQPSEKHSSFKIGDEAFSNQSLTVHWKKVNKDHTIAQDQGKLLNTTTYESSSSVGVFDFGKANSLCFPQFALDAQTALKNWPQDPASEVPEANASLVGIQLLDSVPTLIIELPVM